MLFKKFDLKMLMRALFMASSYISVSILHAQNSISIDGHFEDWAAMPIAVCDPADDVHDTDGYPDGGQPLYREYTDVDILEVKFTNDADNLYGYIKATGEIGRTSSDTLGHAKNGRYYFIYTIDVDDDNTTGYQLKEGGYYPDSRGYDMNMEVEFYNGGFNTGHYINHEFTSQDQVDTQGLQDLADRIVRLAPGTYDYYTQWVTFEDSSYVLVSDRGPVYQGIITIALSEDKHEAELKAPMWGFLKTPAGQRIIDVGQTIVVSASLEGSGELSEEAVKLGHIPGSKSVWGSDTAERFRYDVVDPASRVADNNLDGKKVPASLLLFQHYPNPFSAQTRYSSNGNSGTTFCYRLNKDELVDLSIYNIAGQKICTLVHARQFAGEHRIHWNAGTEFGQQLPSGVYIAVLQAGSTMLAQRMAHLR